MTESRAYSVIPVALMDQKVSTPGENVVYQGDSAGVADFFMDLTLAPGLTYVVKTVASPGRREQVRAGLMRCRVLAAQLEAAMLETRSWFPMESQVTEEAFALEVTAILDQWLYDDLARLQAQLHQAIHPKGEDRE